MLNNWNVGDVIVNTSKNISVTYVGGGILALGVLLLVLGREEQGVAVVGTGLGIMQAGGRRRTKMEGEKTRDLLKEIAAQ